MSNCCKKLQGASQEQILPGRNETNVEEKTKTKMTLLQQRKDAFLFNLQPIHTSYSSYLGTRTFYLFTSQLPFKVKKSLSGQFIIQAIYEV